MPEEFVVITIGVPGTGQYPSLFGDKQYPLDLYTARSVLQTDNMTSQQVFEKMLQAAQDGYLSERRPGAGRLYVEGGRTAVLHYTREINQPSDEDKSSST